MNIAEVKAFLDSFETCVIATMSGDQPQAATVGFSIDDNFQVLIASNESARKAQNLKKNAKVALVVGFKGPKTVQLEGVAEKLDQHQGQGRIKLHFEKVPGAKKFAGESNQTYYLVAPTWLRFTDYTQDPSVFETRSFV